MNALVMRLETRADQAAAAGENELAALLWEAAAAVALSPDHPATGVRTGWPPGMLQDDSRDLSRALARAPGARRLADQAATEIKLEELGRSLERLPAMAWATLRALGSPAPFDLTQSAATADYWRSEGREVVDLLRRSAVIAILRDHSR